MQSLAIADVQPRGVLPYLVLWLHLARARDGEEDAEEFKRNAVSLDLRVWPGPVVAFYFKQMTAQQVVEAAKSGDGKMQRERG
jgi:lipoprotein NlpI